MNLTIPDSGPSTLDAVEDALRHGDREAALTALGGAMNENPDDEDLPLLAAGICLELQRPGQAAEYALRALAIRPFHPPAMDILGVACTDALAVEEAQRVLRAGLRLTPGMANMEDNLRVARRTAKGLLRGAHDRNEVAALAETLPLEDIRALLEPVPERLCAAVVVRDESHAALERCLDALHGVADGILVADARRDKSEPLRSVDPGTVLKVDPDGGVTPHEMLRRLSRADWVLYLEADEWVDGDLPAQLAKLKGKAIAVTLRLTDSNGVQRRALRCVRNACLIRCRGRVTPRLGETLAMLEQRWGLQTVALDTLLRRDRGSYRSTPEEIDRLIHRLDDDLKAEPGNLGARIERAWAHLDRGEPEQAHRMVQPLRMALEEHEATTRAQELEEPVTLEALCLLSQGRPGETGRLLATYHQHSAGCANTLRLAAAAALTAGDPETALRQLEEAVAAEPGFLPPLPQLDSASLAANVGAAFLELGRVEDAGESFGIALAADPDHLEALLGSLTLDFAAGQIEPVLHELDRLAERHGDDRRVWLTGAIVLTQIPELDEVAVDWLVEGTRRHPQDADLRRRLGEAQLLAGHGAEALESWSGLEDPAGEIQAGRAAAILASGGREDLPGLDGSGIEHVISWFQRWMDHEVWEPLDQALVRLPAAREQAPDLVDRTAAWLEQMDQKEAARRLTAG